MQAAWGERPQISSEVTTPYMYATALLAYYHILRTVWNHWQVKLLTFPMKCYPTWITEWGVLRPEIPSGMCANLRTVAASNNRDHSIIACSCHAYIFVLRAHPVRGESHNQRNRRGCNRRNEPTHQWNDTGRFLNANKISVCSLLRLEAVTRSAANYIRH